ncbi:MAG: alkaline phosphatase, partial [Bacteroidota bacterium]|nr:alkaline phosphatase [Bacteroidota bacterium]
MQPWHRSFSWMLIISAFVLLTACETSRQSSAGPIVNNVPEGQKPKNVVFLIGDGMGLPQITGAMYMNNNKIVFERFKNIGFHKSHSSDNLVTDSAAGATAFASGVKTYNGAIGVDAQKQSVPTLLEMAEAKGMATGMVVTCSITHATPAAFIAHVNGREEAEGIALSYLETPIDLFIGGGMKSFTQRVDQRDLVTELQNKGYEISSYFDKDISQFNIRTDKNVGYFTAIGEPLPEREGRDYLPEATRKSLEYLKDRSPNGFFLMIEGSQIDWGGHANDANYVVTELLEFDKVIGQVLDFAEADGNTLVVVTADHETGGFAVNPGSKLNKIEVAFTTKSHT